jgi:competence protein ComEC
MPASTRVCRLLSAYCEIDHSLGPAENLAFSDVDITGFWVMPWAMVTCALMPLGLQGWGLQPMGWGIDAIIAIAHGVTSWPGAVVVLPAMPLAGLLLVTAGGLWLCIWQGRWRLWGGVPIVLGLLAIALVRPPDLVIAGDGKQIAALAADGSYMLAGKTKAMNLETWTRRAASEAGAIFPQDGVSADGSLACDRLGCIYRMRGRSVALLRDPQALDEDCRGVDLVVSPEPARRRCRGAVPVIDRFDLWRGGTHAIWLAPDAITVETVDGWRGERPWVPRHTPRAAARKSRGAEVSSGG